MSAAPSMVYFIKTELPRSSQRHMARDTATRDCLLRQQYLQALIAGGSGRDMLRFQYHRLTVRYVGEKVDRSLSLTRALKVVSRIGMFVDLGPLGTVAHLSDRSFLDLPEALRELQQARQIHQNTPFAELTDAQITAVYAQLTFKSLHALCRAIFDSYDDHEVYCVDVENDSDDDWYCDELAEYHEAQVVSAATAVAMIDFSENETVMSN